jgi:hypothetical protein
MSEKYTCSVCGFESEDWENFYLRRDTSGNVKEFFGVDKICVCDICFFKYLGVRPKNDRRKVPEIIERMTTPVSLNPCDTLTRQKAAEYTPTLIHGCPAEVKKNPVSPKEIIETMEWMIKYFRWQHVQLGTEGDYSPELKKAIDILEQLKKENQ